MAAKNNFHQLQGVSETKTNLTKCGLHFTTLYNDQKTLLADYAYLSLVAKSILKNINHITHVI